MRLKVVFLIFVLILVMISMAELYLARKCYLSNNLLRIDPLEDRSLNKDLLVTPGNINNIWLMGDSRVAQWNKDLLSPLEANTVNLGIEGQTTSQVLNRIKNYFEIGNPQWLILEVGINDLKIIGLNKDLVSRSLEGCLENISKIAELCKIRNINLIIINIFPTGNIEFFRRIVWNSSVDPAIIEANRRLEDYCSKNDAYFFDTYPFLCNEDFKVHEHYQNGSLHLNDKAYKVLSERLIKEFGAKINSKLINNK